MTFLSIEIIQIKPKSAFNLVKNVEDIKRI